MWHYKQDVIFASFTIQNVAFSSFFNPLFLMIVGSFLNINWNTNVKGELKSKGKVATPLWQTHLLSRCKHVSGALILFACSPLYSRIQNLKKVSSHFGQRIRAYGSLDGEVLLSFPKLWVSKISSQYSLLQVGSWPCSRSTVTFCLYYLVYYISRLIQDKCEDLYESSYNTYWVIEWVINVDENSIQTKLIHVEK